MNTPAPRLFWRRTPDPGHGPPKDRGILPEAPTSETCVTPLLRQTHGNHINGPFRRRRRAKSGNEGAAKKRPD